MVRDFPGLKVVLAHGGRGWWYDAAAFMASMREDVWIEVSGLPPKKLPEYYANHDFEQAGAEDDLRHRLARRPRHPQQRRDPPEPRARRRDYIAMILHRNARSVYPLG